MNALFFLIGLIYILVGCALIFFSIFVLKGLFLWVILLLGNILIFRGINFLIKHSFLGFIFGHNVQKWVRSKHDQKRRR